MVERVPDSFVTPMVSAYTPPAASEGTLSPSHPAAEIIHFKGESSRRNKLASRIHFYNSMFIFSKKYFSEKGLYRCAATRPTFSPFSSR